MNLKILPLYDPWLSLQRVNNKHHMFQYSYNIKRMSFFDKDRQKKGIAEHGYWKLQYAW